jgi:SAM-dependent methyltransferase
MQGLSEADRTKILEYRARHGGNHHPWSAQALGWDSQDTQFRLFERFLRLLSFGRVLKGASILDVGCGYGDLLDYINRKGVKIREYTGIDIVPEYIWDAQRRFKGGTFIEGDYLETKVPKADFAVCIGGLNLKFENNRELVRRMHEKMRSDSRSMIAFDLIGDTDNRPLPEHLHLYSGKEISAAITDLPGIFDTEIFHANNSRHQIFSYLGGRK